MKYVFILMCNLKSLYPIETPEAGSGLSTTVFIDPNN